MRKTIWNDYNMKYFRNQDIKWIYYVCLQQPFPWPFSILTLMMALHSLISMRGISNFSMGDFQTTPISCYEGGFKPPP
jgi:hypothetical protein